MAAVAAITHGLFWWQQVVLVALFVLLLGWTLIATYSRAGTRVGAIITFQNVESHVREWLDAFGLGIRRLSDPTCHFAFEVTPSTGIPLGVTRTREHDHYITIMTRIAIGASHRAWYDQLSQSKKDQFLRELRLEASKAKIAFVSDPALNLIIEKRLPITNAFTEADLIDGIGEVNFSAIIIIETVALAFERREVKQPPSSIPGAGASSSS